MAGGRSFSAVLAIVLGKKVVDFRNYPDGNPGYAVKFFDQTQHNVLGLEGGQGVSAPEEEWQQSLCDA